IGLDLSEQLDGDKQSQTAIRDGKWWEEGFVSYTSSDIEAVSTFSVLQYGPDPKRLPPVENSSPDERIVGFVAKVELPENHYEAERAEGWISLSDDQRGVSIGLRNMIEEFPNELAVDLQNNRLHAYTWSPNEEPMSFERASTNPDGGMVGNFARGITKTTEMVLNFHEGDEDAASIQKTVNHILNPPVAHSGAEGITNSVFKEPCEVICTNSSDP